MPKRKIVQNRHAKRRRPAGKTKRAAVTAKTFPASAATPGQTKSRLAFDALQEKREQCKEWWPDFLRLMQDHGLDWRKAAYVAWSASPYRERWPATIKDLAEQVLGCSDRVVRKWRELNPQIEKLIAQEQVAPLMLHRRDVIEALIDVAATPDSGSHSDRKLFLEMTGDYKPRSGVSISGENGSAVKVRFDVSGLPTEILQSLADEGDEEQPAPGGQAGTGAA